jgi:hypothetical protein
MHIFMEADFAAMSISDKHWHKDDLFYPTAALLLKYTLRFIPFSLISPKWESNLKYWYFTDALTAPLFCLLPIRGPLFPTYNKYVTFFPLKAELVWEFFPSGAQKSQTVLKPKAEGQSDTFGLRKERISRLDPTWAGRMTF